MVSFFISFYGRTALLVIFLWYAIAYNRNVPTRNNTSEIIDQLLRFAALSGLTLAAAVAPNTIKLLDKPLQKHLRSMEKRKRNSELRRIVSYMKFQGLITEDYQHGLVITDKARQRLELSDIETIQIENQKKWDKKWRIIFYDIPEKHRSARNALSFKLRQLGCYQLQRSVWIHPFPCKATIDTIAVHYDVGRFITYIEATHIDNQQELVNKFQHLDIN